MLTSKNMEKQKIKLVDLGRQYSQISKEINKAVLEVLASGVYIKGNNLTVFEQKFAEYCIVKYSAGVASGTDALKLSLASLDISKGMEVILPANTFVATAYAVLATGAKPVLVDADEKTLGIDPEKIEQAITKRTKAILPVHLYGFPSEMDKILNISQKYNLFVVEDAAQAHGASYKDKPVGCFGSISAFSFFPGKNLGAYGDGGAITTNSKDIYKRILNLREYGGSKYVYTEIGTNSRLDEIQAAILLVKLKHLGKWNKKRLLAAARYQKLIKKYKIPVTPIEYPTQSQPVYNQFVVRTPKRDSLQKFLLKSGIETAVHYPVPVHLQRSMGILNYKKGDFPVSETASEEILSLPIFPEITANEQESVVAAISSFFGPRHR